MHFWTEVISTDNLIYYERDSDFIRLAIAPRSFFIWWDLTSEVPEGRMLLCNHSEEFEMTYRMSIVARRLYFCCSYDFELGRSQSFVLVVVIDNCDETAIHLSLLSHPSN